MSERRSNSLKSSIDERVHFHSETYQRLFPVNLDIEKVWEISLLQSDSILGADVKDLSIAGELSSNLFDSCKSVWTRAISGAALVHFYSSQNMENIAVKKFIEQLSPSAEDQQRDERTREVVTGGTNDDIVMISMYALMLFRRIEKRNLLESFFECCISTLEICSIQSNPTCSNSSDRVCLSVLSALLSRGVLLNKTLCLVVEENYLGLLTRLFDLFYAKSLSITISREQIAKRLISPLIKLIGNSDMVISSGEKKGVDLLVNLTWSHCDRLANRVEDDLQTCSILLCALMSLPRLEPMSRLGKKSLWTVLSKCFLSSDTVVRKRAAFIMQLIPNTPTSVQVKVSSEIIEERRKEKKPKKALKSKKGFIDDSDQGHGEVLQSVPLTELIKCPIPLNSLSGQRSWWSDFLDIYGQIEGCTSMHLVDQIWPQLEHLCQLAASMNNSDQLLSNISSLLIDESSEFSYPVLDFNWVKALLHILLQISIPGIRKAVLRRILTSDRSKNKGLVLSPSRSTISWICFELFSMIDSVGFFSAYFISQGNDVGNNGCENFIAIDSKINVLAHPGILMPSFLSRLLKSLSIIDKSRIMENSDEIPLVNFLVQSIVHVVCGQNGLHSLSAAKWIVRVFAEPSILALIPPCLGPVQLREMREFFRGRLACSNGVVREHVLQGLLPLFLRGIDAPKVPLKDLLLTVIGGSCFSLDRIVNHAVSFSSLKIAVLDCCIAQLSGTGAGCPLNELDGNILSLAYSIVKDNSTIDEDIILQIDKNPLGSDLYNTRCEMTQLIFFNLDRLCKDHLDTVAKLYMSPYLDVETKQRVAINFLSGVTRSSIIAYNQLQLQDSSVIADRDPSPSSSTPIRMMFPLLSIVRDCSSDLSSYLSIVLISSLTACASDVECACNSSSNTHPVIHNVAILDECTVILCALLLLPRLANPPITVFSEFPVLNVILRTCDSIVALLSSASPSCLGNILTVRCASLLLSALQTSWPSFRINNDTLAKLVVSVSQLTVLLITVTGPSSSAFRTFVSCQESEEIQGPSLLVDLVRIADSQFGRVSTMFMEYRWAGIEAGLQLLMLASSSSVGAIDTVYRGSTSDTEEMREYYQLFTLAIDQLDCCSMLSLPDILSCCLVVAKRFCMIQDGDVHLRDRRTALLLRLLDVAWQTSTGGSVYTDVRAINSFIRLAFDVSMLRYLKHSDVRRYYDQVEALGLKNRPHIMQSLVCALCTAWTIDPSLSTPFFSLIPRMLVYREPRQDDHNVPDNTGRENTSETEIDNGDVNISNDAPSIAGICRFSVLTFLESCLDIVVDSRAWNMTADMVSQQTDLLTTCLGGLIEDLVNLNFREDFIQAAMIGSDLYGQKLRCWQSLCVLTKYMSESRLTSIIEAYFTVLTHSAGHSIRVHVELFGAIMAIRFPTVMMPRLLLALSEFNHTQQTLCSIFVILGHTVLNSPTGAVCDQGVAVDLVTAKAIVSHLLPWTACGSGLPRTVAQLIMHSLIPLVLDSSEESFQTDSDMSTGHAYLRSIMQYLELNRDSSKGMPKQRRFFTESHPLDQCSVQGLTLLGLDNTGEVVAPHILTFLADAMKAEVEMERERVKSKVQTSPLHTIEEMGTVSQTQTPSTAATLQTKIVPFDDLQLGLKSEVLTRQQNAAGRTRQEVVVCASLIDKVTNLAGIARTCEIFAVQELILSNLGIVQTDAFQGIAVSCDQWLPMKEVPVHALTAYLQGMRRRGYTILGLEQTDNSNILGETSDLPSKCVLLLGREKEGIPVELLQEIDYCLEIPQYGVIRSLNVHVSAALAIWEITKMNKKFLEKGN